MWTDEITNMAIAGHRDGISRSVIARLINAEHGTRFTRNAVIGKLNRLGYVDPARNPTKSAPGTRSGSVLRPTKTAGGINGKRGGKISRQMLSPVKRMLTREELIKRAQRIAAFAEQPKPTEPAVLRVPLLDLTDNMCRWPVGDPLAENFGFCGHPKAKGSYCCYHAGVGYVPPGMQRSKGRPRHDLG
jgi:GcrA cell cycle regulator